MTRAATALVLLLFAGGLGPSFAFPQCLHGDAQAMRIGVRRPRADPLWLKLINVSRVAELQDDNPRPWLQGTVEIGCNRSGQQPKGDTTTEWKACACHHGKKEGGSCDDETQGRAWDPKCAAKCSPKHCQCAPNPCGDTN